MARDDRDYGSGSLPYVPVKHTQVQRQHWFDRKEIVERMKSVRKDVEIAHKVERDATSLRHEHQRDTLEYTTRQEADRTRNAVHDSYKPKWSDLYRAHKKEMRYLTKQATHPLERAVYVFMNRERLGQGKPLTLRQMARLIRSQERLIKHVAGAQGKERRALARVEKSEAKTLTDQIWTRHKAAFTALRERQTAERKDQSNEQFAKTRGVSFAHAKATLLAELPPVAPSGPTAPREIHRAEDIKRQMEEWRKRNPGRDFGREM
jgi:hypothetical protein